MHCTYYFLKKLSSELHVQLIDYQLVDCFTQSKNELILCFEKGSTQLQLIVNISREFNAFALKNDFQKSRSGYQNCFKPLLDKKCKGVIQVPYDRSFYLVFADKSKLLFKMYGSRSNVILLDKEDKAIQLFNPQHLDDWNLELQELQQAAPIYDDFFHEDTLLESNPFIGKNAKIWLKKEFKNTTTIAQKHKIYQDFLGEVNDWKNGFFIHNLQITPVQDIYYQQFETSIAASNALYQRLNYFYFFVKRKENTQIELERQIKRLRAYLTNAQKELEKLVIGFGFKEKADVIMANLHILTHPEQEYTLHYFYTEASFDFRFKKGEKPQLIAQKWYSKSKNQHKQVAKLEETIQKKETQLLALQSDLQILADITSSKDLTIFLKTKEKESKPENELPFKQIQFEGFEILVGRNSKNNDELVKFGHKDDIWLHAKDVSGSHVLIRCKQQKVPKTVLERAASLAAYYSKRKTDSLCPVMYTELKYVKKRKGFLPGQVVTEREQVILIRPVAISESTLG